MFRVHQQTLAGARGSKSRFLVVTRDTDRAVVATYEFGAARMELHTTDLSEISEMVCFLRETGLTAFADLVLEEL